ncbi:hypothetical protein HUJ05_008365 [Dendroctonus ponderosae]|nr:hypothetical protein HUJ05_008365 [Dendroctonus ponderosae]
MLPSIIKVWIVGWCQISVCLASVYQRREYRIGGLFNDPVHQAAFELALMEKEDWEQPFQLMADSFNVSLYSSLESRRAVCALIKRGVVGIFGPSSHFTSNYIQSMCDSKEIPQIETHYATKIYRNRCSVNLHPYTEEIAQFFVHLASRLFLAIRSYNWESVIILFEDDESLRRIAPLLRLNIDYGINLVFRQLELDSSGSYREVLTSIKKMPDAHILLECSIDILGDVLKQAQQVALLSDNYKFIITNLDFGILDLEPFQYGGTNITGIRMFDPLDETVVAFQRQIQKTLQTDENAGEPKMRLSTALVIDGVNMFHQVIKELDSFPSAVEAQSLDCQDTQAWKFGYTIANQIKGKEFMGITKRILFDFEGFRRDFKLEVISLTNEGLIKVGQWDTTTKQLTVERQHVPSLDATETEFNIFNRTFSIAIVLTAPYAMLKETTDQLTGNDRFEGFCIDVIEELSAILKFNYTFVVQHDGKNGNFNRSTNQWDGVIRAIIDKKADLAITDLTITSERENAVDFTMPFMNLGIRILYRKPEPVPPSLFMFTSPFSTGVWLMLGVAYILVSIFIFIMGRLSPSEWNNPFPCIDEPEYLVNQFSIRNSLWYTIGGLLQQGSELAPISISTRTASGFWWFFVLIIVASYTANLAAFLTVETLVTPFKNIDELARQTEIKYGAKKLGATENFFRDSNISTHQRVYTYMKQHPGYMVMENEEGVRRVEAENYAYLMESTSIEYVTQRHCSLSHVGGLLDDKGYGIAMEKNSPYRNELSSKVIKLQETGVLNQLKDKWWKEKRGGSTCSAKSEESEAEALDLQNVGGVFLVLFLGAFLGFLGSFLEMIFGMYRKCRREDASFANCLKKELRFFVKFKETVKNVQTLESDEKAQM